MFFLVVLFNNKPRNVRNQNILCDHVILGIYLILFNSFFNEFYSNFSVAINFLIL